MLGHVAQRFGVAEDGLDATLEGVERRNRRDGHDEADGSRHQRLGDRAHHVAVLRGLLDQVAVLRLERARASLGPAVDPAMRRANRNDLANRAVVREILAHAACPARPGARVARYARRVIE